MHTILAAKYLVLQKAANQYAYFEMSQNPQLQFTEGAVTFVAGESQVEISLSDYTKFFFSDKILTGIRAVHESCENLLIKVEDGQMLVSGLSAGEAAHIVALDGRLLSVLRANASGHCEMNIQDWPAGTYVVRTNIHSYKVIKR